MATKRKRTARAPAPAPEADAVTATANGNRGAGRTPDGVTDGIAARVRAAWGLSRKTFARMTGFSERTVAAWESGAPAGEAGLRRLRELERLHEGLGRVMRAEFLPQWLDTPNQAFGGLKPLEVLERGEADRLWSMIFYLDSGVPS